MGKKRYDNTNSGAAFKNERRRNDKDPKFTGTLDVNGDQYWVNVWVNDHEEKGQYLKFTVKPKTDREDAPRGKGGGDFEQRQAPPSKPAPSQKSGGDFNDDIAF